MFNTLRFKQKKRSQQMVEYKNPIPVVVGIVVVKTKVLVVKRAIEPFIGQWALAGGYLEMGTDWETHLQKEIWDEARVWVSNDHKDIEVFDMYSTPDTSKLLIFVPYKDKAVLSVDEFVPNDEVSERAFHKVEPWHNNLPKLCFPLHERAMSRYQNSLPDLSVQY